MSGETHKTQFRKFTGALANDCSCRHANHPNQRGHCDCPIHRGNRQARSFAINTRRKSRAPSDYKTRNLTMPTVQEQRTLTPEVLHNIDAYWRAANYLSVGQIYLYDNPLLKRPLELSDIKHMLLGHWGTTPGQNFIYAHLNRVINKYDLDMIYVSGPGHGGPAVVANTYLEGTYSEIYPEISQDEDGLAKVVPSVFVSRWHPQPRFAGVPRFDSRRRRAGLFAQPCVRCRVRQSGTDRRVRRRRRRSGNRTACHCMALQQVPQPCQRRRGAADPAPQRIQDRQSHPFWLASNTKNSINCFAATDGLPTSSKVTIRS